MAPMQPNRSTESVPGSQDLFRVREPDWSNVWGENLTRAEAQRLKDRIVAVDKKSRVTTIRPMSEIVPDWYQEMLGEAETTSTSCTMGSPTAPAAAPAPPPPEGTLYDVSAAVKDVIKHDGAVMRIPHAHVLLINGQERPVPCRVAKGEHLECRPLNPALAGARAVANGAVSQVIRDKRRYTDMTVRKPVARKRPPPPDVTVKAQRVVRLGAPPVKPAQKFTAPWIAAEQQDGEELPADAITDDDLPEISADLGGAESAADVEHAKRQAEAERNAG